jgi:histone H3/H4
MKKLKLKPADYLRGCADFLACLKPFMRLQETSEGLECELTLANGQTVKVEGEDQPHLLLNLMAVLVDLLPQAGKREQPVTAPVSRNAPADRQAMETIMQPQAIAKPTDEKTRTARETIGLTTKITMHRLVKSVAAQRGVSVSTAARDLLQDGLARFDRASRTVDPTDLLTDYERKANDHGGGESENWVIRADRKLVVRARLRAGENERSLSAFSNFIIAEALSECPIASALQAAVPAPVITEEAIAFVIQKVEQVCGVNAGALAPQIDLGKNRVLTNMVLGGAVSAPARVLTKLAGVLAVPFAVLQIALERRFAVQTVPAFKATEGKPIVQTERKAWSVAVRELHLSADEEERLLNLEG